MAYIEEIAKDAKLIEIDDQLLVLIKRQVETELMLEEKFRDLCEEVSNFVKETEDVVKEVERLSCKYVVKETVRLFRRGQKRELYKMTRLQMMVNESHLSVREKHTFVSSELTLLAGSELKTSELDTSELKTSEYSSDTRPPMLDRTDFASWQQRILLYCRGTEGAPHLGPERPRVYSDLSPEDKERYNADIRATNILLQGLPKDIYTLINHYTDAKDIWDNVKMLLEGSELTKKDRESQLYDDSKYFKDKMLLMQAQENGVALDEEQLSFIAADDCDAFDSDVDEAPTTQTMFMANLSSADPIYDEVGPSYDSDILSEVHDHDHYQDAVCDHHEEHKMHDDDNIVPVVQSNVSSVPNDAYMMIFNDMHEPHAQSVSNTTQNTIVDYSLTTELPTYKEQVELYERRARFELTKREQMIDE
ncbi:hypothetical protein Tco_1219324 [Tanacetum coccineum]